MNRAGGTSAARWWPRWAAVGAIVITTAAHAAVPDLTHLSPVSEGSARTNTTAAGSAAAQPASPQTGQVGLYENESIRRTPAAGSSAGGGAGATTPTTATPWSLSHVPAALAAVLILIVGIRWLVKKMSGGSVGNRSTRAMRVLARSTVSPRQQLMLIQIGKRLVLVGNSGGTMSPLCQIDDANEVASLVSQIRAEQASTPASSFKSLFGGANNDYEMPATPSLFKSRPAEEPDRDEEPGDQSAAVDLLDRREMRDEVTLSGAGEAAGSVNPTDDPAVAPSSGDLTELVAKVRRMSQGFQR